MQTFEQFSLYTLRSQRIANNHPSSKVTPLFVIYLLSIIVDDKRHRVLPSVEADRNLFRPFSSPDLTASNIIRDAVYYGKRWNQLFSVL